MTTVAMRKKLHDYLDSAADKKIKAIYTMVEDELEEEKEDYSDEFKAELDRLWLLVNEIGLPSMSDS